MLQLISRRSINFGSLLAAATFTAAQLAAGPVQTVFVIAMENHNWTQPANQFTGKIQQIYLNPNAPFINSLVNGTATANINGVSTDISKQVAYTSTYYNVLATPSGNNPSIHPSEPNYIWAEAGSNLGVTNDNDPYVSPGGTNQNTTQHLSTYLTNAGRTWRSYQEDIDLTPVNGQLTNTVAPKSQWTSPINSASGTFASGTNAYNGSNQYNYAVKHNPMAFFTDTNGGNNSTPSNPAAQNYAPLQQFSTDLKNNTVANYNWITPDQYNDMHSTLTCGYKGLTGDAASIKQGDDFLSQLVPMIMASAAYQNNGAIVLWWDESESDGVAGDNANDFNHTIPEIIISPDAHANVNGLPYDSTIANYTHSSDLRTMQEIFGVGPYLGDAANATDLSDLFAPGSIRPLAAVPEPATYAIALVGLGLMGLLRRRARL
jgi:phosphatidylinositol-3-phosphatase